MQRGPEHILDEMLIYSARRGDSPALRTLIERWQRRLWLHARRLTGDPEAASDVTQDALLAIARTIRRLDDPARFPAWAYRITTNRSIDFIRRRARNRTLTNSMRTASASNPPDHTSAGDKNAALRAAVSDLRPDIRAMLTMCYVHGMSIAHIAAAFDVHTGTVKSRLHAARQSLKNALERTDQ